MSVTLNPYLNSRGEAREAMDFSKSVFGGELTRMTFADGGMPVDDAEKDQVVHSQLMADGQTLMGSDVPSRMTGEIANGDRLAQRG